MSNKIMFPNTDIFLGNLYSTEDFKQELNCLHKANIHFSKNNKKNIYSIFNVCVSYDFAFILSETKEAVLIIPFNNENIFEVERLSDIATINSNRLN